MITCDAIPAGSASFDTIDLFMILEPTSTGSGLNFCSNADFEVNETLTPILFHQHVLHAEYVHNILHMGKKKTEDDPAVITSCLQTTTKFHSLIGRHAPTEKPITRICKIKSTS